jgi:hypothetical protein
LFSSSSLLDEDTVPLTGYDNVPIDATRKKVASALKTKLIKEESLSDLQLSLSTSKSNKTSITEQNNYVNLQRSKLSSTRLSDDEAPILMPKQHQPMKKSSSIKQRAEQLIQSEHYQLPPKDTDQQHDDKDEYQPPLPPKQRHQQNTSRALVYDFIGSELQELRATLAQFNGNSFSKFSPIIFDCMHLTYIDESYLSFKTIMSS